MLVFLFVFEYLSAQSYHYTETGLPVCYIETAKEVSISSKYEYVPARIRIEKGGMTLVDDSASVRLHGNATLYFPKKSFKLRFFDKVSPFDGMGKNRSFVLLANYSDKSLMKTSVGFRIGNEIDFRWVPRSEFVELVVNGEYVGNYQFAENVKKGKNRLDIDDSGFLIEFDFDYKHSQHYFTTIVNGWNFTSKYPDDDEMVYSIFSYAENCMNAFEQALYSSVFPTDRSYTKLIDEESFAKWYYWKNLLQMEETNRYFLKNDNSTNSRIEMGPLWDFEWCLGVTDSHERPSHQHYFVNKLYFNRIVDDSLFMQRIYDLHQQYGEHVRAAVIDHYSMLKDSLQLSQALNFQRWPILNEPISLAKIPIGSWEGEADADLQFFLEHYDWLTEQLSAYAEAGIHVATPGAGKSDDTYYTLSGQRVSGTLRPGIYVKKGKKILLKIE